MSVKKTSEETTVRYEVVGEQPMEQFSGPKIDPHEVVVLINDGKMHSVWVHGLQYNANGKLGKKRGSTVVVDGREAPQWLRTIISDLKLEWWPRND